MTSIISALFISLSFWVRYINLFEASLSSSEHCEGHGHVPGEPVEECVAQLLVHGHPRVLVDQAHRLHRNAHLESRFIFIRNLLPTDLRFLKCPSKCFAYVD